MNKLAVATVLIAFVTLLAPAYAGPPDVPVCCACLSVGSSPVNGTAQSAIFCAPSTSDQTGPLADRCVALDPTAQLLCRVTLDSNTSCRVEFAETGVLCPASLAPAASPLNLATLTVALAAVGALLLHRRRRA